VKSRGWHVAAASVRGAGHEKLGMPCQDAHQWEAVGEGILVVAVTDGAGSAPLADAGASLAARAAVEHVRERLSSPTPASGLDDEAWAGLLRECAACAQKALETEAAARGVPPQDLATTLSLVAATPEVVAAVQVGDGAVVVTGADGCLHALVRPVVGEYLNETTFLTSKEALATLHPAIWRGQPRHLAVFSDGLQMAALRMPSGEPHPGFFTPLFEFLQGQPDPGQATQALAAFLGSERLRERTDDDVTLVLATWLE
jgi:hypothetical protein